MKKGKELVKDYKGICGFKGKTFTPSSPKSISSLLKEQEKKIRKDIKNDKKILKDKE